MSGAMLGLLIAAAAGAQGVGSWLPVMSAGQQTPYWIDTANIRTLGERRTFSMRVITGNGSAAFDNGVDCATGKLDAMKYEIAYGDGRLVMRRLDKSDPMVAALVHAVCD